MSANVRATAFVERIHAIYDRDAPRQIHPHIGEAFRVPESGDLRILAVGINSYVSPKDRGKESPSWLAGWFVEQTHRYQRGVWRDLKALGDAITQPPYWFASKRFRGMDSIFLTNAVKIYVDEAVGKQAAQLSAADYERHLAQWHDELDAMADHGALPDVIAIIGEPFWSFACASLQKPGAFKEVRTTSFRSCSGTCRHFLNTVDIDTRHGEREVLLLRLRHPAGRSRTGSPRWLLGQAEFQSVASTAEP
ncbi:MAG: hypothetical protein KIT84_28000 [Labilithrix sp.]|nr:hypothetical protein [Labilithrix sp.]MCW5814902.1 hypothetical protein [Labilithrix sp.]